MKDQIHDDVFKEIVSKLQSTDPIEIGHMSKLNLQPKQCCLFDLLIIFYNNALRDSKKMDQENKNYFQSSQFNLMNQILPLISKLVDLKQPAKSLAQFNYQQFTKCCQQSGQLELLRHSKGLLPYINTDIDNIPIYYPYYKKLKNLPFGNPNWKMARLVLKKRYIAIKRPIDPIINLCYCILLGEQSLIQQVGINPWNKIWADTYLKFLVEGLTRADQLQQNKIKGMNEKNTTYLSQLHTFDDIENQTIFIALCMVIDNKEKLLKNVWDNILQLKHDEMFLLLNSIIYKIAQIKKIRNLQKQCQNVFQQNLKNHFIEDTRWIEQMMVIYRNKEQIIKHFIKSNRFPTYVFNKSIMVEISKYYLQNSPRQIAKILDYIEKQELIFYLLESEMLQSEEIGQEIIKHLQKHKKRYVQILQSKSRKPIGLQKDLQQFIKRWKLFHKAITNKQSQRPSENTISYKIQAVYELLQQPKYRFTDNFSRIAKIREPTQSNKNKYLLIKLYSEMLAKIVSQKEYQYVQTKCLQAYKQDYFINMLQQLQQNKNDQIWSILSVVLMKDSKLIYQLVLAIQDGI